MRYKSDMKMLPRLVINIDEKLHKKTSYVLILLLLLICYLFIKIKNNECDFRYCL